MSKKETTQKNLLDALIVYLRGIHASRIEWTDNGI